MDRGTLGDLILRCEIAISVYDISRMHAQIRCHEAIRSINLSLMKKISRIEWHRVRQSYVEHGETGEVQAQETHKAELQDKAVAKT
jgi:hypothetical protein